MPSGELTNLTELYLPENRLTTLPPQIGKLRQLEMLDLTGNQLSALPPQMGDLTKLTNLDLSDNPLTSPLLEIVSQGVKAVLAYLREQLARGEQEQ